jgi:hypothetical protein
MPTQCSPMEIESGRVGGRRSWGWYGLLGRGSLLFGEAERRSGLTDRFTSCFAVRRSWLFAVPLISPIFKSNGPPAAPSVAGPARPPSSPRFNRYEDQHETRVYRFLRSGFGGFNSVR